MRSVAAATIAIVMSGAAAEAEPQNYRTEFTVSALGIPVGQSQFDTVIDGDSYAMKGSLKSNGLVSLFAPTAGSIAVNGRIRNRTVEADSFALAYKSGSDAQKTRIAFSNGVVTNTVNEPRIKKKPGWIDVAAGDLRDAVDPISAMLVKASSPGGVCARTVRVYDGAMRADFELSFVRTIPFRTEGFDGEAITCKARFKPVSGYPENKREITWMRDKGDIEVSFAPVRGTDLYAPVAATVGTQIGTVRVRATRFEAVNGNPLEITVQ